MKKLIFVFLILAFASCGDNAKDVIIKHLHSEQVCKDSGYRFCRVAVDTAGIIQPIHQLNGIIFSFPKQQDNEK